MINGPDPDPLPSYRDRIAVLPGDPRIAYRPRDVVVQGSEGQRRLAEILGVDPEQEADRNARVPSLLARLSEEQRAHEIVERLLADKRIVDWFKAEDVDDAPAVVAQLEHEGIPAHLNVVYFANARCCGVCPPHPALAIAMAANPYAANPYAANPYAANPYAANPYAANPYSANPYSANPYSANAESLNVAATGRPPTSSVLPARQRMITRRPDVDRSNIVIGVLDSGLAGGPDDTGDLRPDELGTNTAALMRISGADDVPSADGDLYLDPVAGHGTFIAGLIEQLTPGARSPSARSSSRRATSASTNSSSPSSSS